VTGTRLRAAAERVVAGDAGSLAILAEAPHDQLLEAAAGANLTVGGDSVARVLQSLDRHEIGQAQAQRWGSFVRRGYVAGRGDQGPVKPLPIDYDPTYEDIITEIISRLDEIGDVVDGDVPSSAEIGGYLALLGLPKSG
jgi:hypothetical protein